MTLFLGPFQISEMVSGTRKKTCFAFHPLCFSLLPRFITMKPNANTLGGKSCCAAVAMPQIRKMQVRLHRARRSGGNLGSASSVQFRAFADSRGFRVFILPFIAAAWEEMRGAG